MGLDQDFLPSCPLKADSKMVELICWEWLFSTTFFLQSVLILSLFHTQHAYIGFLAWLELLLESRLLGPKPVPHGRPVQQTNKPIFHFQRNEATPQKCSDSNWRHGQHCIALGGADVRLTNNSHNRFILSLRNNAGCWFGLLA